MCITNATNFRKNLYEFLNSTINSNEIVTVTTKSGNVVMINEEEYKGMLETLYLASIPGLMENIIEGINTPLSDLVEVDWKNELRN